MIKAEQKKWAYLIFDPYLRRLLKKNFSGFYISGNTPAADENKSLVITPNHFSWWDGFFIYFAASKMLNKKCYMMMLEEQLNRFWFFKKLGAFSVNSKNFVSLKNTLAYTGDLISDPENMVVIFPQGEIQQFNTGYRPLKKGLMSVIEKKFETTEVMNAAFKIEYGEEKLPYIIGRFGDKISGESIINNFSAYEDSFYNNIEKLKSISARDFNSFDLFKKK